MKRLGGFLGLLALAAVLMGQSPGSAPIGAGPGGGGSGGGAPCTAFGTASGQCTQGGVITAGGPTGSATVAPIITYNAAGQLTTVSSATITPAVGSITGLGTGVATALGVNIGSAGAFVTFNGALGTPSSGVATNLTGTAAGLTAGTVTTNANLTGPITSSGNATAIASQTGTGTKFVVDTSPTLVTPVLGVATATSLDGAAIGGMTPSTGVFTTLSSGNLNVTSATIPTNGLYLSAANAPSISVNGVLTQSWGIAGSSSNISVAGNVINTYRNSNNGATATNQFRLGNDVSGQELNITINSSGNSGGNGASSSTINAISGLWLQGNGTNAIAINTSGIVGIATRATIGSATAAAGQNGDLGQIKETDAAAAPGAGYVVLKWVAGTNSGSCKLISYAGTSASPVTIVDNVGASC